MIDLLDVSDRDGLTPTQKFAVRTFAWEEGLRDRVLAACGDQNTFGLEMGRVLFQHSCGVSGPISEADRILNKYVLDGWLSGKPCCRWVVSRHTVAGVIVEITSDLATGATRIRKPPCPPRLRDGRDE